MFTTVSTRHVAYVLFACLAGCAATRTTAPEARRVAVDSYVLLGQVALEQQQPQEATGHYLNAALASDDPAVAERATRMAHRLGMTDLGLAAVERWRELAPEDERTWWFSAIFETRSRRLGRAIDDFTRLIERLNDPGAGLALVIDALSAEPDSAAGTVIMSALNDAFPGTAEGHYGLASLALRSGNFELALDNAATAAELAPDWLEIQLLYARTLLGAGRTDESLELAAELAEQHEDSEVRLQYAELLLSAGRGDDAVVIFNELLADNPGMPEAIRALAFHALTSDELDTATERFNELRTDSRYQNESFFYLGRIAEQQEEYLRATRSYSRVIDGSHVIEAQMRVAAILRAQMDDPEGALRHLEEFGNANPRFSSEMLLARSQMLLQMRAPEEAVKLFDDALAENSADPALHAAHVRLYVVLAQDSIDREDFDAAGAALSEGLDRYPGNISLRYSRALLLQEQGRHRRSVDVLEALVEENPNDASLLNALGYLLTDQFSNRHEEARGYIQRALAMNPDSAAIIDSMGWVLFRLGDYDAALEYLERAYRLEQDPEIAAHLVDVRWALGEREAALEFLESSLEEHPDDQHLQDVSRRLDR